MYEQNRDIISCIPIFNTRWKQKVGFLLWMLHAGATRTYGYWAGAGWILGLVWKQCRREKLLLHQESNIYSLFPG
jgi:hypothetical protein